jgi:hypothetical protein
MTKSNPMIPIWIQVQMLQISVPLSTSLFESSANKAWQVDTALECLAAESMTQARATRSATRTKMILKRALAARAWSAQSIESAHPPSPVLLGFEERGPFPVDAEETNSLKDGYHDTDGAQNV